MSRMLTQKEIDALIKENNILKRENKYFKTLFNSKRFKFAEKIATSYNGIFPKNTKRRSMMESVGGTGKKILEANKAKKHKMLKRRPE